VELLTAHPGNVRRDLWLDQDFLDSIAELGILTPLRITPDGAGGYRVIEGHRRLAAAGKLGLTEVPCDLALERERDEAGQFLDMYAANHHRKQLSTLEEADALFAASASGATRTRIRKATGLGRDDVAAAIKAGGMTGFARETAAGFGQAITLEQLVLLAEFEDDAGAVGRIMTDICNGHSGQHAAERIRQERAEAAEHERLAARLIADGYTVTGEIPPGGSSLHVLVHDGRELTPEGHAGCPGRGVFFHGGRPLDPVHYCADPAANGHESRYQSTQLPDLGGGGGAAPPAQQPAPDPNRRLVIEGNRAWTAARTVRTRWLADTLFQRRTAPKEAMPFIAGQLVAMPAPLRDAITHAPRSAVFRQITGDGIRADEVAGWGTARLPVAVLAVIAAAYETQMDGDAGRDTWRTDRPYPRCPRADAGGYFRFLASVGYELSAIEQAVADGVPYTGDEADPGLADGTGPDHEPDETSGTEDRSAGREVTCDATAQPTGAES
jgi:ParB family chromosome partitioning protein